MSREQYDSYIVTSLLWRLNSGLLSWLLQCISLSFGQIIWLWHC